MGRKIIQIAVAPAEPATKAHEQGDNYLVALCDDGSVWELQEPQPPAARQWVRVEAIPQD